MLKFAQMKRIEELRHQGLSYEAIAKRIRVSRQAVSRFCTKNEITKEKKKVARYPVPDSCEITISFADHADPITVSDVMCTLLNIQAG